MDEKTCRHCGTPVRFSDSGCLWDVGTHDFSAPFAPPVSDPSETPPPLSPERLKAILQPPAETLALIAEYVTILRRDPNGGWIARGPKGLGEDFADGHGPTIGDAVRAVVKRIREGNRG